MSEDLSRRERQIMDIMFRAGECNAREVRAALPDAPSYSAVRALMAKLVDKGLLKIRSEGNRYLYSPTEDPSRASRSALRHLVATFFDDSPVKAANALLGMDPEVIDEQELARLKQLIDSLDGKEPGP